MRRSGLLRRRGRRFLRGGEARGRGVGVEGVYLYGVFVEDAKRLRSMA